MIVIHVGKQIIARVLADQSIKSFTEAGLTGAWLDTEASAAIFEGVNTRAYAYLLRHADVHGRVPSIELFRREFPESGYRLPAEPAQPSELIELVRTETDRTIIQLAQMRIQDILTGDNAIQGNEETVRLASQVVQQAADQLGTGIRQWSTILNLTEPMDREKYFAEKLTQGAPFGVAAVDDDFYGIQPGQLITLIGRQKSSKALALGTPLPTPTGWTTMGEVKPGDMLLDSAGAPCRVIDVTSIQYGRPCYAVKFRSGETIITDKDHRWVTDRKETNGKRSVAVRSTEEIRETLRYAGANRHRIPVAGELDLDPVFLPVDPYALGYWLGNGGANQPRITCSKEDVPFLQEQFKRAGLPVTWEREDPRSAAVDMRVNTLRPGLGYLGVFGQKHIPQVYLRAGVCQRLALLQGLMDSDGCATGKEARIGQKSERLVDGIEELMLSLGIRPNRKVYRAKLNGKDCGPVHLLTYTGPRRDLFRLPRKKSIASQWAGLWVKSGYRYISAVDPVDSVPVRCLAVDSPDHTYLAGRGMIPTHNTFMALNSAVQAWLEGWNVLFYTFEMGAKEIRDRAYALGAHVNPDKIRRRDLNVAYKRQIEDFMDQLEGDSDAGEDFRIVEGAGATSYEDIRAEVTKYNPHMVYIDGFYFIFDRETRKSAGSHWEANENVARDLKILARQLDIGILVTTQAQEKQRSLRAQGIEAHTIMGGTGLLRTSDLVMGLDMDPIKRVLTLNCIFSRHAHVQSGKYTWDWDTMRLQGCLDEDLEEDIRAMGI